MHILVVGVNHRTAPIDIREKLAFDQAGIDEALTTLRHTKSIFEDVIVSTCNRTEIYVVCDQLHTGRYYTKTFFYNWFGIEKSGLTPFLFIKEDDEAISHLFHVACGLDSMVLGETQILGQVRDSFLAAQKNHTTGTLFNELFKEAVTVAKRGQFETQINDHPVSASYTAVELAKQIFGRLDDKRVLIVGAGEMGELALKHFTSQGVRQVVIVNRTMEKAEKLAGQVSGRAEPLSELGRLLGDADILISSTSARDFILRVEDVEKAVAIRKGRPLFMVDIAVPRDIDPKIDRLDGVFLYDIDDLAGIVEANVQERKKAALAMEPLIAAQITKFSEWLQTLGVVPVITALRKKALAVQAETMKSIERKLPDLTERERKVISKHTKSIVNQLLRDPIQKIKEMAGREDREAALQMFMAIFDIEEDVLQEKVKKEKKSESKKTAVQEGRLAFTDD